MLPPRQRARAIAAALLDGAWDTRAMTARLEVTFEVKPAWERNGVRHYAHYLSGLAAEVGAVKK